MRTFICVVAHHNFKVFGESPCKEQVAWEGWNKSSIYYRTEREGTIVGVEYLEIVGIN